MCLNRVGNSRPLTLWCPPEGRAEPLASKPEEHRNVSARTGSSEYLYKMSVQTSQNNPCGVRNFTPFIALRL